MWVLIAVHTATDSGSSVDTMPRLWVDAVLTHNAHIHSCARCACVPIAPQVQLAKPLISLLSKEWHHKQAGQRPNIIQALLDGIAVCQPQPKISPEIIKFLGECDRSL